MVQVGVMAKSRSPEADHLQADAERCGCGRAYDGDTTGSRLQRGDHRQGVDMGRPLPSLQCHEARESEPVGEERRGGVGAAGEGWAVDV